MYDKEIEKNRKSGQMLLIISLCMVLISGVVWVLRSNALGVFLFLGSLFVVLFALDFKRNAQLMILLKDLEELKKNGN